MTRCEGRADELRIRSIKPEFWRSPDISALDWETRLLFIGLWSYVDDNGVGRDEMPNIVGDLFAADMLADSRETVARVSRGLSQLSASNLITRYEVDGRQYLAIVNWSRHQKIDRPGKPRYPRPDADSAKTRESVASPRETPSLGTGEQGNRGTDIYTSDSADADTRRTSSTDDGAFDEWWKKYPRKVGKGQARKAFKAALKKTTLEELHSGLDAYLVQVQEKEPDFIAHPSTWLNGERWSDEPVKKKGVSSLWDRQV